MCVCVWVYAVCTFSLRPVKQGLGAINKRHKQYNEWKEEHVEFDFNVGCWY